MKAQLIAIAATIALTGPAFAQEANKIDPAKNGPTESMTEKVPDMKTPTAAANPTEQYSPTKNVGDAVPAMKPTDAKPTDKASEAKSDGVVKDTTSKE